MAQIQGSLPDLTPIQQQNLVSSIESIIEQQIQLVISTQGTQGLIGLTGRPVSTNIETNFQAAQGKSQ